MNVPLARDGKLVTLRLTLPVNPFCLTMVTVYVVEFPRVTDRELGAAEIVKLGGATGFTTRVTLAECARLPEVPWIVMVEVPAAVVGAVVTFKVELAPAATVVEVKLAPTPVGNALVRLKVMFPLKPFSALVFTV